MIVELEVEGEIVFRQEEKHSEMRVLLMHLPPYARRHYPDKKWTIFTRKTSSMNSGFYIKGIDVEEIMYMISIGKTYKQISIHFDCCIDTISKRVRDFKISNKIK